MTDAPETSLRAGRLNTFWQDRLRSEFGKHFPLVSQFSKLIDHWKIDGFNDGTTTIYGVYDIGDKEYWMLTVPDYAEISWAPVVPRIKHVGWNQYEEGVNE